MAAGVAAGIAERAQLLEAHIGETGLFFQLPGAGAVEALVGVHEAPGKRPLALVRRELALHQQHHQIVGAHGKDDDVDGDRRPRILVAVHAPPSMV